MHLIAVPQTEIGLARAIGEAHRRYTRRINFRENWRGHLWQERFASFPMDERHLFAALRYVEMNPVAAGMVSASARYSWSNAKSHIEGTDDPLASPLPRQDMIPFPTGPIFCACLQKKNSKRSNGMKIQGAIGL